MEVCLSGERSPVSYTHLDGYKRQKEALMLERGYPEVSPHDFYRELFPAGSLQQEPEDGKGNIIALSLIHI